MRIEEKKKEKKRDLVDEGNHSYMKITPGALQTFQFLHFTGRGECDEMQHTHGSRETNALFLLQRTKVPDFTL